MQQLFAGQGKAVVLSDQCRSTFILQTYIGRDRLILVGWLIHILTDLVEQFHLHVGLVQLLVKLIGTQYSLLGVQSDIHHTVLLLVLLQVGIVTGQLCRNLCQSAVDEVFCALLYLVLVDVCLIVVGINQTVEEVNASFSALIVEGQLHGVSRLLGLVHGQTLEVFLRSLERRNHLHLQLSTFLQLIDRVLCQGQCTRLGSDLCREFGEGFVDFVRSLFEGFCIDRLEILTLYVVDTSLTGDGQLHRSIQLLQAGGVHVHVYFLLGIDQRIYQHAAVLVLSVELQVLDGLLYQKA